MHISYGIVACSRPAFTDSAAPGVVKRAKVTMRNPYGVRALWQGPTYFGPLGGLKETEREDAFS